MACQNNTVLTDTLAPLDLITTLSISSELGAMQQSLTSLSLASTTALRIYWDSAYHHK